TPPMMWPLNLRSPRARRALRRRQALRPWTVERMEDRTLLSTFTVTNTNDSGDGSLRQSLLNAYDSYVHGDTDNTIVFNIPETDRGKDPHTGAFVIRPRSTLGQGAPVVIDGYSQPGSSRNTLAVGDNAVLRIELDGSLAGDGAYGLYLNHTDHCTVAGLDIHSFSGVGISIDGGGGNNVVVGNFIG